jgi:hypothetical protein
MAKVTDDEQKEQCMAVVKAISKAVKDLDVPLGRAIRALVVLSGDALSQWADDEVSLEFNIGLFEKNLREIARSLYKRRMGNDTNGHSQHAGTDKAD